MATFPLRYRYLVMLFDPRIHSFSQLAKSVLGRLEKMRGGLNHDRDELLVLNYHSTPRKFIAEFKEQVRFLSKHFNIIRPSDLHSYFTGGYQSGKCSLLFTFDDGLKNNLYAAEFLHEMNMRALFFIVPGFINTPASDQKQFYLKNIRPLVNKRIDQEAEDFSPMSWSDLEGLMKNGHSVGAHTLTHTLVAANSSQENSEAEIFGCKQEMENKLKVPVWSFCSINDTLVSTGKKEKVLIGGNYLMHFTTLPGSNAVKKDPLFIKRRNVECFWPAGAFYYALGQSDLKRWKKKIELYQDL